MHEEAGTGALGNDERCACRSDQAGDEGAIARTDTVDRRGGAAAEGVGVGRVIGTGEAEARREQRRAVDVPADERLLADELVADDGGAGGAELRRRRVVRGDSRLARASCAGDEGEDDGEKVKAASGVHAAIVGAR